METSILKQIAGLLTERKKHRRWLVAFACMAVVVGFGTVAALRMMGQAMTQKVKVLDCRLEVHQHVPECYDQERNLICGYADYVVHMHNDDCHGVNGELVCTLPEIEVHKHSEACYTEQQIQTCGQEESAGHVHTEACYAREQGGLLCQTPEHIHGAGCYDANGTLICGAAEHTHSDGCFVWNDVLTCQMGEGTGGHTHGAGCYGNQKVLSCGKLELHVHTEKCFEKIDKDAEYSEENRRLICTIPQLEEHIHSDEFGCFQTVEITGGEDTEQKGDAVQEDEDGAGEIPDELRNADITRTYEGEGYIVTAAYNEDANIPEEAEFIAEQITAESSGEYYAEREAAFKESMGDENATMNGLFKIGFYVNGEEVEPESAVSITIQFLDENGMPDGTPITVVHFAKEGTEVLDGGNAEGGKTTFEMDSFSEVAIGYKPADMGPIQISESYEYESDAFRITFHIEGEATPLKAKGKGTDTEAGETADAAVEQEIELEPKEGSADEKLEFTVRQLEKGSEEYEAFAAYAEPEDGSELLQLQAFSYSLSYNGVRMDLSKCEVTAEVRTTETLSEHAAVSIPEAVSYLRDDITLEGEGTAVNAEEEETEIIIAAAEISKDAQVNELGNIVLNREAVNGVMTMALEEDAIAVAASKSANPDFTVQYYAELDLIADQGTNALPIIDTDNGGNGSGGKLPVNGKGLGVSPNGNAIRNIYVDNSGNIELTRNSLTEVYKSRAYKYIKAPTLKYFDALLDKDGYKLKEIWVLKHTHDDTCYALDEEGNRGELTCIEADNKDKDQWDIYPYSADIHFTNREVSANEQYIYIRQDSVLRLVYEVNKAEPDFPVAFYDYDISDGGIYANVSDAQGQTNKKATSGQKNGTLSYAYTKAAGINSAGNYSGAGTKLGFGNVNTGTTLGDNLWNGNLLNKYNATQGIHPAVAGTYEGCTFGLVKALEGNTIQYASGVDAPKLFNDGDAAGKTAYGNYSLKFKRSGDTYTLSAVNGTGVSGLESFGHPSPYSGKTYTNIWTNDFWPMDSASSSYGADGHDMKFGSYTYRANRAFAGSTTTGEPGSTSKTKKTFPYSDDGKDHNSYFGMNYQVNFDLSEDYVGPLEYYFFGDDDMWVFLDGKLVCDIGGVHSSVGEYVNLWDYLEKGSSGSHTLSFYYTERGASGSTCWMQFTLPSVSSIAPPTSDKDYGHLQIDKTVIEVNGDKESVTESEDKFSFLLWLTDADGHALRDDFAYTIYDKNKQEIDSDIIVWDGAVADGERFTLKGGQYIVIDYLPKGTKYRIQEEGVQQSDSNSDTIYYTDIEIDNKKVGEDIEDYGDKIAEGSIGSATTSLVSYKNKYRIYELPETGGNGWIIYTIAGVLCILLGAGFMYRKKSGKGGRDIPLGTE